MKFTTNRTTLLTALSTTYKAVATSYIVPITECFLFDIAPNSLTIAATNMKFYIRTKCEIAGGEVKSIAINANRLLSFVKDLADQSLTFEITDTVTITHANGSCQIPFDDGKDFPAPLENKSKQKLSVNSDIILNGLEKTQFAVALDRKDRPVLETLNIIIDGNKAYFRAADGFKFSLWSYDITSKVKANVAIPLYNLPALAALPANTQIDVIIDKANIGFYYGDTAILFTLFDEPYPDLTTVITKGQDKFAGVDKVILLSTLARVKGFANKQTQQVKLEFGTDLTISAKNLDYSYSAQESIACEYDSPHFAIGVNAEFLFTAVKNLDSDTVWFCMIDAVNAIVLRSDKNDLECDSLVLVMPSVLKGGANG